MIVPSSTLPQSTSPMQDNQPRPDQAMLLMAAAEMHKLGRLGGGEDDTDTPASPLAPPKAKPSHRGMRRR